MHTHSSPTCPQCGIVIPDEAAGRLCPRCVFAKALAPTADGTFVPHSPPGLDEVRAAFPHLEVIGLIGSGGMGAVFKARQPQLDRFVALKILPADLAGQSGFSERFQREAQALARLSHPNIVSVHDFGQAGGFYHLLMEFVDGVNLRQLLQTKKLTPKEALSIVPPVCDALQCAHDHGIVHRDIKPENLLIDKKGGVKIADFGIAKIVARESDPGAGDEETRADSRTTALGTPDYAAPEQQNGTADHRADIYSLGVVLYEMLTGERPKEKLEAPSKRVQVDVRIDEIVLRALEKTPELRFATAAEFRTRVEELEHSPQQNSATPRSVRSLWWLAGGIFVALLAALWAVLAAIDYKSPLGTRELMSLVALSLGLGWWIHHRGPDKVTPGSRLPARGARSFLSMAFRVFLLIGGLIGMASRVEITPTPPAFRSTAKLLNQHHAKASADSSPQDGAWGDPGARAVLALISTELARRSHTRATSLYPQGPSSDIKVEARGDRDSPIIEVVVVGASREFVQIYGNALIDEFLAAQTQAGHDDFVIVERATWPTSVTSGKWPVWKLWMQAEPDQSPKTAVGNEPESISGKRTPEKAIDPAARDTASYDEITRAARKEHRQKLATSLLEADHAEILLLDFDIVANKQLSRLTARQSGLDLIPGTKFPIYPMGTTANVLDRKMLTKEQLAPLLPRLAAAVRTEEGGHDWCHFPVHGLRLYRGKEEIFESSFCWVCSTFTLLYPDHSDLHPVHDEELQRLMEQWMPVPAKELERLKAKRPNLFVFRAPEEVMTQVRNDLTALMELPSSFGRGPGDVEKALSDLHAEIARKPKAFEYSRDELAAFRKDECPYSDADMEEAFVRLQAAVNGRPLPGLPAFYRAKLTAGSLTPKQKTIGYRMVSSLLAEVEDRTAGSSTTGTAGNSSQGSLQLRWIRDTPSGETEPMPLAGRGQKQTLNVDKTILLDETALQTVEAIHGDGGSKIALQLTENGKQRFADLTREGKGRRLAIIIDGRVHAAPMIMAEIRDGRVEISGTLTGEEADDLAARLQTALKDNHEHLKQPAQGGPEKNPPAASTSPASKAPSGEDHVFDEPLHQALRVASKDAVPHFQFAAGKAFLIRTPSAASQDEIKADWDKANAVGGVDFSISDEAGDILIHPRGCLFGKWMDGMAAYSSSASQTMTLGAMLGASTEPIRLVRGQWPVSCVFRTARGLIGWMTVSSVNHVADKADRLFFEYRLVKKLGGAPQTVSEFYQKANQRWDQRDYQGAVTVYDEAIKQHTAESGLFNNRANAHAALENYDKALADYAEALRLAPGHSNIHRARSLAYVQMGDYDRAISDLDIAVKASPEGVNFDLRGRAYHAKGDYQAALADYEKGVQATPGYTFTLMDLAWLLATCPDQEIRDGQKASQYASLAAAALQTSHAEVLVAQAAARAEERDYAGAIQLEQSFLRTLPTDSVEAVGSRERLKLYQAHQPLRSPMPIFRSLWR